MPHSAHAAAKKPPSIRRAHALALRPGERPPRSLDDPGFQAELDNLTDPLRDETFFHSVLHVWLGAFATALLVSLPILFLIWQYGDVFASLNHALSGMAAKSGVP